jgi:hypothetical protein
MDADRAKAIVRCVETVLTTGPESATGVEFVRVSDEHELMVFGPCRARRHPLAAAGGNHPLAVPPGRTQRHCGGGTGGGPARPGRKPSPPSRTGKKAMLLEIRDQLAHHRRMSQVNPMEILLVDSA